MSATRRRPEGKPWRAAKRRAGRLSQRRDCVATPAPQSPLDFALAVMRDDSKSDALRVSVAKAALPYLHTRGQEQEKEQEKDSTESAPKSEPMSDLEVARRIAHILLLGNKQEEREAALVPGAAQPLFPLPACGERVDREAIRVRGHGSTEGTVPPHPPRSARHLLPASGEKELHEAAAQLAEAEERAQRDDQPDPHPGYRWIP